MNKSITSSSLPPNIPTTGKSCQSNTGGIKKLKNIVEKIKGDDEFKKKEESTRKIAEEEDFTNFEVNGIKINFNRADENEINFSQPFYFHSGAPDTVVPDYVVKPIVFSKTDSFHDYDEIEDEITAKIKQGEEFEAVCDYFINTTSKQTCGSINKFG